MKIKNFIKYLENVREDDSSHLNDKLAANKKNERGEYDYDDDSTKDYGQYGEYDDFYDEEDEDYYAGRSDDDDDVCLSSTCTSSSSLSSSSLSSPRSVYLLSPIGGIKADADPPNETFRLDKMNRRIGDGSCNRPSPSPTSCNSSPSPLASSEVYARSEGRLPRFVDSTSFSFSVGDTDRFRPDDDEEEVA